MSNLNKNNPQKIQRSQVINKSDVLFILAIILGSIFCIFFFLFVGGFTEFGYAIGGGSRSSALKLGARVVLFLCGIGICGFIFLVGLVVRWGEKADQTKPSVYKMAFKRFWKWFWLK